MFARDDTAASEIVSTMLLILIVTGAATTLGLFVQDQAELAGEQKLHQAKRNAESLEVLGLDFVDVEFNDGSGTGLPDGLLERMTLSVASAWTKPTDISSIQIRQRQAEQDAFLFVTKFSAISSFTQDATATKVDFLKEGGCRYGRYFDETEGACVDDAAASPPFAEAASEYHPSFAIQPREHFVITVDFRDGVTTSDGHDPRAHLATNVTLRTSLGNSFGMEAAPAVVVAGADVVGLEIRLQADATFSPEGKALDNLEYYVAQFDDPDCPLYAGPEPLGYPTGPLAADLGDPGWWNEDAPYNPDFGDPVDTEVTIVLANPGSCNGDVTYRAITLVSDADGLVGRSIIDFDVTFS